VTPIPSGLFKKTRVFFRRPPPTMQARPARPCARCAAPGVLGAAVAGGKCVLGVVCVWVDFYADLVAWSAGIRQRRSGSWG
jgi:hypothetical protein